MLLGGIANNLKWVDTDKYNYNTWQRKEPTANNLFRQNAKLKVRSNQPWFL